MTIINGLSLLSAAPIKDMSLCKVKEHGVSHGLGEVGYDIRIKQDVTFLPAEYWGNNLHMPPRLYIQGSHGAAGNFCIASAIEEFQMPSNLCGIVHDKSTWARRGLSVFNTVIEPGWRGFLTLELVFHGREKLHIPAGAGIAQVIFHEIKNPTTYEGKYQDQADEPVKAVFG